MDKPTFDQEEIILRINNEKLFSSKDKIYKELEGYKKLKDYSVDFYNEVLACFYGIKICQINCNEVSRSTLEKEGNSNPDWCISDQNKKRYCIEITRANLYTKSDLSETIDSEFNTYLQDNKGNQFLDFFAGGSGNWNKSTQLPPNEERLNENKILKKTLKEERLNEIGKRLNEILHFSYLEGKPLKDDKKFTELVKGFAKTKKYNNLEYDPKYISDVNETYDTDDEESQITQVYRSINKKFEKYSDQQTDNGILVIDTSGFISDFLDFFQENLPRFYSQKQTLDIRKKWLKTINDESFKTEHSFFNKVIVFSYLKEKAICFDYQNNKWNTRFVDIDLWFL